MRRQHLEGAERVDARQRPAPEGDRTPFPRRREGDFSRRREALAGQCRGERDSGLVLGRDAAGESPEAVLQRLAVEGAERLQGPEGQLVGGQRPGLVHAQDVGVAQRLDGVDLLDEGALLGDGGGTERIGDDDDEEQPIGNLAGEDGGELDDADRRGVLQERGEEDRAAHQDDDQHDDAHGEIDLALERRLDQLELARLRRQPVGVARRADDIGAVRPLAADADAAGEDAVAAGLAHRFRFAGEQRLVDLEGARRHQRAVDHDLVAGAQADVVVLDDLGRVAGGVAAVANQGHRRAVEEGDAVELALGAQLLDRADDGVDQTEADAGEGVVDFAEHDQRGADGEQDVVEEGEEVGAGDGEVGAAGGGPVVVALAARPPRARLRLGEATVVGAGHGGGLLLDGGHDAASALFCAFDHAKASAGRH